MPARPAEVYSIREVARAAGVSVDRIAGLVASSSVATLDGTYLSERQAVQAVRLVRAQERRAHVLQRAGTADQTAAGSRPLFGSALRKRRPTGFPLLASTGLHATAFGLVGLLSTLGAFEPVLS